MASKKPRKASARKSVSKSASKKAGRKSALSATKQPVRPATKRLQKQVRSLRREVKENEAAIRRNRQVVAKARSATQKAVAKSAKQTQRVATQARSLDQELEELRKELDALKKKPKVTRKALSDYNVFMRKMIRKGLSFRQSAREWSRLKKLEGKRKPSAYNQFLASQLRQGKTFKQAVALWNRLKKGPLKARTVTKTVIKRVRSKPKEVVKYKTRTRTVVKRVKSKPKEVVKYKTRTVKVRQPARVRTKTITVEKKVPVDKPVFVTKEVFPEEKMRRLLAETISEHRIVSMVQKAVADSRLRAHSNSDQVEAVLDKLTSERAFFSGVSEVASVNIVRTYFEEVARFGLKKSLSLDEVIDAFFHVQARLAHVSGSHAPHAHAPEDVAHRLVHLYFSEVARLGIKRRLDLDEVVQAYFHTLSRLKGRGASHAHSPARSESAGSHDSHEHVSVTVKADHVTVEEKKDSSADRSSSAAHHHS